MAVRVYHTDGICRALCLGQTKNILFLVDCLKIWVSRKKRFFGRNNFDFPGNSSRIAMFASSTTNVDGRLATGSDEVAMGKLNRT